MVAIFQAKRKKVILNIPLLHLLLLALGAIHPFTYPSIHPSIRPSIQPSIQLLIHSFIHLVNSRLSCNCWSPDIVCIWLWDYGMNKTSPCSRGAYLGSVQVVYHCFPFSFSTYSHEGVLSHGADQILGSVLELSPPPDWQPAWNVIIPNGEGEVEKAAFGWLNSFQSWTLLLSGSSRGTDHRGRGSWLYQREKASLCVVVGTGPRDLSAVLWTGLS